MKKLAFIAVALALVSTSVKAAPTLSAAVTDPQGMTENVTGNSYKGKLPKSVVAQTTKSVSAKYNAGAKPGKWCGWYARTLFGGGPEYNLARNWAKRGRSAGGPAVGAVVVWAHHVGVIVGRAANGQWLVHSGNDGNRVRTRARSVSGAIAFRFV